MITANKGQVMLAGTTTELLADLVAITSSIKKVIAPEMGEVAADKMIDEAISIARMSEAEFDKELEKAKAQAFNVIFGTGKDGK